MSRATLVHGLGVGGGVAIAGIAGAVLGGPWWAVAVAAAGGALGGRPGSLVQAVATLALVGGASSAGHSWLVPLLLVGSVGTVEGGALVERSTDPSQPSEARSALVAPVVAGALAATVLVVADLGPGPAVPLAVLAAAGATVALAAARS